MTTLDFNVRIPIWARWLGEYRAWRTAVRARKNHAIFMAKPKLQAVVVGKILYHGGPVGGASAHIWELMATPAGKRTVVYRFVGEKWMKDCTAEQHPLYQWIREWEGGLREVIYKENEVRFTYPKVNS